MQWFRYAVSLIVLIPILQATTLSQDTPSGVQASSPGALSNKDIVFMVKAGLSAEIIVAKIQDTGGTFDTSPNTLSELKSSGVPDSVILAMITSRSPKKEPIEGPTPAPVSNKAPIEGLTLTPSIGLHGYAISSEGNTDEIVRGSKNALRGHWGFNDTTYRAVANLIVGALVSNLARASLNQVTYLEADCCTISVRVTNVVLHNSTFGYYTKDKTTVDVRLDVTDSHGAIIYSKQYSAHREGRLKQEASSYLPDVCNDLAVKASADDALVKILRTGKP